MTLLRTHHSFILVLCACCFLTSLAQEKKRVQYQSGSPFVRDIDLTAELLEGFVLMQKANTGEAPAEHELGLRYLEGRTVPADTVKGAYWIGKAAAQGLPLAQYNLGILYNHGWGVPWNPFEAFKSFRAAAQQEMPEAEYIVGLMYTEGLVMPRSWKTAYDWIKRAADKGFEPAKETAEEFKAKNLMAKDAPADSGNGKKPRRETATPTDTSLTPVFLSFQTDTSRDVSDTVIVREALQQISTPAMQRRAQEDLQRAVAADTTWRLTLLRAASQGNPEALVALGRFFEHGIGVQRDAVIAAAYYFRAIRLDSPRAPGLLWNLLRQQSFAEELDARSKRSDPDALYVWAGITAVGFSHLLNDQQALQILERAVAMNHVPAMLELGLCYFTGRWVQQDKMHAAEIWTTASHHGSVEADVRLATAVVLGELPAATIAEPLTVLRNAAQEGSVLAQSALGYCYEKGIDVAKNKGEASSLYRKAALRGSQIAYRSLRRMHDELRPPDKEFQLID